MWRSFSMDLRSQILMVVDDGLTSNPESSDDGCLTANRINYAPATLNPETLDYKDYLGL